MNILKKRSTALAVLIIVIVFGTLFGVHRSVGAGTKEIEAQFYSGVKLSDYTQASISDMLSERSNNALGAVTLISGNYEALDDEADALRTAREKLIDAETIEEKYLANVGLTKAADALKEAASAEALTERDSEGLSMYLRDIESAQKVIDASDYNSLVREYRNGTLRSFPVNILKNLAFCDYPSYFNVEG